MWYEGIRRNNNPKKAWLGYNFNDHIVINSSVFSSKIEKPCNDQLRLIGKLIGIKRNKEKLALCERPKKRKNL